MKLVAIDIETTGLSHVKDSVLGISVAWRDADGIKARYYEPEDFQSTELNEFINSSIVVGHNYRFDYKFLRQAGLAKPLPLGTTNNAGRVGGAWEDTKLIATLIDENTAHGLKSLAVKYLGKDATAFKAALDGHLKQLKLTMKDLKDPRVDKNLIASYCMEDSINTLRLYEVLSVKLTDKQRNYYYTEMLPIEYVLAEMELAGNYIDEEKLLICESALVSRISETAAWLGNEVKDEINTIELKLWEKEKSKRKTEKGKAGVKRPVFNWGSLPQKTALFYDSSLGLGRYCSATTDKGSPTLLKKDVDRCNIEDERLKAVLARYYDWQAYQKMLTTYCVGIKERLVDGKIYGEYHQISREEFGTEGKGGTVTGRLSHRNPNLGNLPRGGKDYYKGAFVKDLFIPSRGNVFIYADFSQIELRVVAELAGDRAFIKSFKNGEDPHQATADTIGITRQAAKTVNFLIAYGGSAWRLAIELKKNPHNDAELNECEAIRRNFFAAHPELDQWIQKVRRLARNQEHVTTPFGITRRLPQASSMIKEDREHALKQAVNFMVQSTAVSLAKRAMIALHEHGFKLRNQVHDSIICETMMEDAEHDLERMLSIMAMQGIIAGFSIPMLADGKIISTFNEKNVVTLKGENNEHQISV